MLRLTKTQKEIESLAGRLQPIPQGDYEWAIAHFPYFMQIPQGRTECACPNCHTHFNPYEVERTEGSKWNKDDYTIKCPYCGATIQLRIESWLTKASVCRRQEDFFQVMQVVGGWQVTRLIYMQRYCYARKENTPWEFYEVCQAWNRPSEGKTHFRALPKKMMANHYLNPYSLWEIIPLKDENGNHLRFEDGFLKCESKPRPLEPRRAGSANYFETTAIAPSSRLLPAYRKYGFGKQALDKTKKIHNAMWWFECFSGKNYKPMYETLLKLKDYDMLKRATEYRYRDNAEQYFSAWKVCQRRGYKPADKSEWFDLVQMLIELRMDIRSPHYVCPADLNAMHQHILNLHNRERDRIELEKKAEENKEYMKRIAKFKDMDIHNSRLHIIVLPTIKAFKEEGDALGHCVYRCGYYSHKDSLILSARDDSGKRWETLEVSLKTFEILQCYGYGDKFSERHKEIRTLMSKNMWQVRERMGRVTAC